MIFSQSFSVEIGWIFRWCCGVVCLGYWFSSVLYHWLLNQFIYSPLYHTAFIHFDQGIYFYRYKVVKINSSKYFDGKVCCAFMCSTCLILNKILNQLQHQRTLNFPFLVFCLSWWHQQFNHHRHLFNHYKPRFLLRALDSSYALIDVNEQLLT